MRYQPKSVLIEINNECNFNCRHCYAEGNTNNIELSLVVVQKTLKQLSELGAKNIAFSGGEPFLHPDLFAMIKSAKALGFNVIIDTNGSLIDYQTACALKQLNVDLINISLHGYYYYEHEFLTQKEGSFESVLETLNVLCNTGVPCGLNIALNPKNYLNAHKIILIALSYKVQSISYFKVFETGRSKGDKDLLLTVEEHKTVFQNIKELLEQFSHHPFELYTELPYIYKSLGNERLYACGISSESFVISNKGNVYLCNALRDGELVCGSIYENSLEEIWNNSELFCSIREIRSNPNRLLGKCSKCDYYNICMGGCRACSYNIYGDFIHSDTKCWLQDRIKSPIEI